MADANAASAAERTPPQGAREALEQNLWKIYAGQATCVAGVGNKTATTERRPVSMTFRPRRRRESERVPPVRPASSGSWSSGELRTATGAGRRAPSCGCLVAG
jgi:hypothetical protein